jgi:quercetin dioxygenase-like cupin family protein
MSEQNSAYFKDYHDFICFKEDRYGKATLFENEAVLVGVNCMTPGQSLSKHAHEEQNRFYYVIEGQGDVKIEDEERHVAAGSVAWIPAGVAHTVVNSSDRPLIMLVSIVPAHGE